MSHNHSHHHFEGDDQSSKKIGWAFFLNFSFTIIEFIGGWLTNSTAIMADAVHDLGDTLSIGSAWVLNKLGHKQANSQFTYGYKRLSLFGALFNAIVLTIGSIWVFSEAIPRLFNPQMPQTEGMMLLAVLGIAVNGFAAYKLHGGSTLNEKVLNWHLLEDVLGWVAVLIVAIVMQFVDWPILDPLLSIAFTLFIMLNVIKHAIETMRLFFQASPSSPSVDEVKKELLNINQVQEIHQLHIWSLDGEYHVATAHVVSYCTSLTDYNAVKSQVASVLKPFGFANTTIEVELAEENCRDN
ncbi:cation diffusion facilitator family transporter [Alteromonas lipotrueiana]|uniref:cation diffusion facilitator family transporter n=1 Tax=Alteromonas lipotrueiana TaxID=2803815 RepID=UPI001C487EE5|nr:cation diffusion facilitator family transporter [Alteromonas lipotrueiana]